MVHLQSQHTANSNVICLNHLTSPYMDSVSSILPRAIATRILYAVGVDPYIQVLRVDNACCCCGERRLLCNGSKRGKNGDWRWWMSSHGSCLEETRRTMYERWENEYCQYIL